MFHFDNEYPLSVDSVVSSPVRFKKATLSALKDFKNAKPWRGTLDERIEKFSTLINELSMIYRIKPPLLDTSSVDPSECSDRSYYMPLTHSIYLVGRLSVITLLHEFAHALGKGEYGACRWSLNLFKQIFPSQWQKLSFHGHVARRRDPR